MANMSARGPADAGSVEPQGAIRAADAADHSRDSLRVIFNASSEGLTLCRLIRGRDGRAIDYQVLDVNPAHALLTGATRERMLAQPVTSIAPPVDPRWLASAAAAVATGRPQQFDVRSNQTGRWLDIRVSPVRDDLFAQTFIDVTGRREAETLRKALLAEMNHRVKNNFQMVAAVLELQARQAEQSAVREQLQSAVQRVYVLAELHASLTPDEDVDRVEVDGYLRTLCAKLAASIQNPERIRLTVVSEPARLAADCVVPLGFVVNELVTNAIKYAFPGASEGQIAVTFRREAAGHVLTVADDGVGLQAGAEAAGAGLGMRLVRAFVAQVGGKMEVRHNPGVTYRIALP
jgi:two-component sensor histidine kinase